MIKKGPSGIFVFCSANVSWMMNVTGYSSLKIFTDFMGLFSCYSIEYVISSYYFLVLILIQSVHKITYKGPKVALHMRFSKSAVRFQIL